MRQIATTFFALLILMADATANDNTLTAPQIRELLSGNTAIGHWVDHNYRQYFAENGSTIYAQENVRSASGRWRVNTSNNQYESWWEQSGWGSGYNITLKDGVYYWVGGGTAKPQPFKIVAGQQLVAKE